LTSPESETRISLADRYCVIANGLRLNGQYDDALVEAYKALVIYKEFLGENDLRTAGCYQFSGQALCDKGLHEEALFELRKSLAIRRELRGENHQHTADIYETIGNVLVLQGRNDDALIGYGKALAIRIKLSGGDKHPETAKGYYNIGSALFRKSQNKEALDSFRKAHTIYKRELGDAYPDTLDKESYIQHIELREKKKKIQMSDFRAKHFFSIIVRISEKGFHQKNFKFNINL